MITMDKRKECMTHKLYKLFKKDSKQLLFCKTHFKLLIHNNWDKSRKIYYILKLRWTSQLCLRMFLLFWMETRLRYFWMVQFFILIKSYCWLNRPIKDSIKTRFRFLKAWAILYRMFIIYCYDTNQKNLCMTSQNCQNYEKS